MEETVQVTIKGPGQSWKDLMALAEEWGRKYPEATLMSAYGYGKIDLQLKMPAFTTVTPPQLIDATTQEGGETKDARDIG